MELTKKQKKTLTTDLLDFASRCLAGEGTPQEVASLPAILSILLQHENDLRA